MRINFVLKSSLFIMLFALLFIGSKVCASDVTMSGDIAYQIKDNEVTFWVERITNNTFFTNSGTLKLKLLATIDPYSGGYINGYIIAQRNIGTLQAGYSFESVKVVTDYLRPPAGSYFLTIILTEWNGSIDVIVDYKNLSGGLQVQKNSSNDNGGDNGGGSGCFISTLLF